MTEFELQPGSGPLLISLPHAGFAIPAEQQQRYTARALASEDSDWHLQAVYAPLAEQLGASLLLPRWSRYLIDLNRPASDTPMYAGVNNTGLCPLTHFDGQPLYRPGQQPDAAERARRVRQHWQPYHQALQAELQRLKALHGFALLWDGHSIETELPWLFPGRLPQLNLGSNAGAACAPERLQRVAAVLAAQPDYTQVVDGRFKGGYITRAYGQPAQGVHALQMEMVQSVYMLEDKAHPTPRPFLEARAARLRPLLARLLQAFAA